MLVNISNRILDEDKLYKNICEFEVMNNQKAYIFMNKETLGELASSYGPLIYFQVAERGDGIISSYCGRRVYENEKLKFGDVEIR